MPSFRCCDCGEIKATKCDLEAHLNADHIGWTPYQCFYCCQQGVSTRKPNKELLREHVTQRHPDQSFTFIFTDDQTNEKQLKDLLHRSISQDVPIIDVNATTGSSSPVDNDSPSVIYLSASPQPKEEVRDMGQLEGCSPMTNNGDMVALVEATTPNKEYTAVDESCSSRCATCRKSVPGKLMLIRDHVKLHFKEKTGCLPVDLTDLLPNLQQLYCQLLMASFPSVDTSILDDDDLNFNKEPDASGLVEMDNVEDNSEYSADYECNDCGEKFRRLASLKTHLSRACTRLYNQEQQSRRVTRPARVANFHHSVVEASHILAPCDICGKEFPTMRRMHSHRAKKHGITVRYHCKQCKLDIDGGLVRAHLLQVHQKRAYECSLCKSSAVEPKTINLHDREFHGGLGKALVVSNRHVQLDALQKKLIIDLNTSSRSDKKLSSNNKVRKSTNLRRRTCRPKREYRIIKTSTNTAIVVHQTEMSCEICHEVFANEQGLKIHRSLKHGIFVKWYCKQCDVNLATGSVNTHLLTSHLGKKAIYECSLCERKIDSGSIIRHDKLHHGGLRKAVVVNNLHYYEEQLEALQKMWIVDLNSSSGKNLAKSKKLAIHHNQATQNGVHRIPPIQRNFRSIRSDPKLKHLKVKCSPALSCELCSESFSSTRSMARHKNSKHHIVVNWYCNQCKINLGTKYTLHLLRVHMRKKVYVCSLCDSTICNSKILTAHDVIRHKGMGEAKIIYNPHRYRHEIEELRDTLIIGINMVKVGNATKQKLRGLQSTTIVRSKSGHHITSDNIIWLKRFKRSQKRKQKPDEILSKRYVVQGLGSEEFSRMSPEL